MAESYSAKSLTVLEGLDAVRKRPGMYIGTTDSLGIMHCLWEIIDNAVDEALCGVCNRIIITLHSDGSIEVEDNGRGIPVDIEPHTQLSGVEVVLTRLHAGGKFGNSSYNSVGGLHGVGSSVVNALSSRLDVEVDRDGKTYRMEFKQGHPGIFNDKDSKNPSPDSSFKRTPKGKPTELRVVGKVSPRTTGTRIRYWLDPEIFNSTARFNYNMLIERVRQTSFLVPGLYFKVIDENISSSTTTETEIFDGTDISNEASIQTLETDDNGNIDLREDRENVENRETEETIDSDSAYLLAAEKSSVAHPRIQEFIHEGGIVDFVDFLSQGGPVTDIFHLTGSHTYVEETQQVGEDGELHTVELTRNCEVDIAFRWTTTYDSIIRSFVNVVQTPGGGSHVEGFINSLTRHIRKTAEANARKFKINLKDSKMKIERDDVIVGLVAIVSVRLPEPQFQGQTKDVLGTAQVRPIVTRVVDRQFGEIITGSVRGSKIQATKILEKVVGEMHARIQARKAKEVTRRKNALESAAMPSKLSDCLPGNDDIAELFIVEGDSALGTAKAARNSQFQALLPIRGKILNVEKASLTQMLNNAECSAIIQVVGAGSGHDFDINQSRYNKIIMMTDADVDGAHIRILLLTLFYRYMRPLVEHGYVYAAVPPLHRIALAGSKKGEYIYTYSEEELAERLAELDMQNIAYNPDIQRYKGLGEMDADQLADTTMDPRSRILRRIRVEDMEKASQIFDLLMGDCVPPRKSFIVSHAQTFDRTQIDA